MGNKENMDITREDNEDMQEQEYISLYKALDIIFENADVIDEQSSFRNTSKNKLRRGLDRVLGEEAYKHLKKSDSEQYSIPVKGVNCIAILLNVDLKKELDKRYGGELSQNASNGAEEEKQSKRKRYRSDIERLFRTDFENTDIAARLYLRSQLKMLFSGCSNKVQKEIVKAYNIKYIPEAEEAFKQIEKLKLQVDKLLENWDTDQGTFHVISETCKMSNRYIVAEVQMLLYKSILEPDLQNVIAKLQP